MTKFADQLYDDLMRQHGTALADIAPLQASPRHVTPRRVLLTVGAGGLAAAAATAGVLATGSGAPAYAVTANHDGSINLAVYKESGIAQINAKLRELHSRVVVVPVRAGCPAIGSLPHPDVHPQGLTTVESGRAGTGAITVSAQGIPAGDILVVGAETTAHGAQMTSAVITKAPAPGCVSIAPPPGSAGMTGHGHGPSTSQG
jgi:hypothetical protein